MMIAHQNAKKLRGLVDSPYKRLTHSGAIPPRMCLQVVLQALQSLMAGAFARRLTIIGRYGLCFSKHVAMAAHHALVSGF